MNKTELLDRCAHSGEERVLLARVLDKLELCQRRNIPAWTPFLSPGEQAAASDLLRAWGAPRCLAAGGYEGAERNILCFLPDWQEPDFLSGPDSPLEPGDLRKASDFFSGTVTGTTRREVLGKAKL